MYGSRLESIANTKYILSQVILNTIKGLHRTTEPYLLFAASKQFKTLKNFTVYFFLMAFMIIKVMKYIVRNLATPQLSSHND